MAGAPLRQRGCGWLSFPRQSRAAGRGSKAGGWQSRLLQPPRTAWVDLEHCDQRCETGSLIPGFNSLTVDCENLNKALVDLSSVGLCENGF